MFDDDDVDTDDACSTESWRVYFLTLSDPSRQGHDFELVKVGITKGEVERRIANLQTGNPYRIRYEASFTSTQGRAVESWIHRTNNLKHLEWIKLPRNQIPRLVEEARRESDRLVNIAEAEARWKTVESTGRIRLPAATDLELHDGMKAIEEKLLPTKLRLSITIHRIALLAGNVWYIPGVTRIRRREAFKKFKANLARERFPDLVAELTTKTVQGQLRVKGWLNKTAPLVAELRAEEKSLDRRCKELNASMLAHPECVIPEGPRTDELAELHDRFLQLINKKVRLDIDKKELRAQAINVTENWDGVDGLWSHKRKRGQRFNGSAFRANYRDAAAQCAVTGEPFIHRHIFFSRCY
jgi:hypothetical protein